MLIDLDTLRTGLHDHGIAETADGQPAARRHIRRMCCDADDHPRRPRCRTVSPSTSAANNASPPAINAEPCGRCTPPAPTPSCTVRFDNCQIHHVVPWEHGGPTDLDNLLPLCSTHHHLVHEGGWTLTLHPDRTIELRRPDGTTHYTGTTITRAPTGLTTPTHHQHATRRHTSTSRLTARAL